ncbi:transglycosylase-associated protein [Caballeronia choica]|uniref:Transglycosylase-associated protein n=2 Tax=Caballeronia choica TaxID=326476 RepID=A0A158G984_9BURK|nr:transglycosylase-associated protein [Caballeronia choica]
MEFMQHGLIWALIIGAVAGWLAGLLVKGGGFGLLVDILVGIVGAVIGGWLFSALGVSLGGGLLGSLLTAVIGAVVLLFAIRLFRRA